MLAANFWNGGVWFLTFRYFRASTRLVDNYKCDESQIQVCGYWSTVMMMITASACFKPFRINSDIEQMFDEQKDCWRWNFNVDKILSLHIRSYY